MFTIEIVPNASLRVWRDGEWVVIGAEDGGGGRTTVSLTGQQALDFAAVLRGAGVDALNTTGVHA